MKKATKAAKKPPAKPKSVGVYKTNVKRGPKVGEHGHKVTYSIRITEQVREFLRERKAGKAGDFVDDVIRKTADFQAFAKTFKKIPESQ